MDLQARALFGGAITMAIHHRFADISEVRQVPDNQEVCDTTDSTCISTYSILFSSDRRLSNMSDRNDQFYRH